MKNKPRAIPIDLLRILAASAIFYYHAGSLAGWKFSLWGEFGVASFIYLTAYCALRFLRPPSGNLAHYWLARLKAIYPTFAVIAIGIFVASFFHSPSKMSGHYTPVGFGGKSFDDQRIRRTAG